MDDVNVIVELSMKSMSLTDQIEEALIHGKLRSQNSDVEYLNEDLMEITRLLMSKCEIQTQILDAQNRMMERLFNENKNRHSLN